MNVADVHRSVGRSRAAVKIQEGCDQVCAYCIVPRVRGRERSVPPDEIVSKVRALSQGGCPEVVLTGTQLGSYGFDIPGANLRELLIMILASTDIRRLRVSSVQPQELDDGLLDVWRVHGTARLAPHFHMPLQSGSDAVLGRMRRRYTAADYERAVSRVRKTVPGASVTTDVICGFPGETEEDHLNTLAVMRRVQFTDAHVFPYSSRPGTSAAHFDDHVDPATKRDGRRRRGCWRLSRLPVTDALLLANGGRFCGKGSAGDPALLKTTFVSPSPTLRRIDFSPLMTITRPTTLSNEL